MKDSFLTPILGVSTPHTLKNYVFNQHMVMGIYSHSSKEGFNRFPRVFLLLTSWAIVLAVFINMEVAKYGPGSIPKNREGPVNKSEISASMYSVYWTMYCAFVLIPLLSVFKLLLKLAYMDNSPRGVSDVKSLVIISKIMHTLRTARNALIVYLLTIAVIVAGIVYPMVQASDEDLIKDPQGMKEALLTATYSWLLYIVVFEPVLLIVTYKLFRACGKGSAKIVDDEPTPKHSRGIYL